MADSPNSTMSNQLTLTHQLAQIKPFRFLDLPAELRLCVYDFCTEDSALPTQRQKSPKPNFVGLIHTCRQIRREFRAKWLRESPKWLMIDENIEGYLNAYYPSRSSENPAQINLTIMLPVPKLRYANGLWQQLSHAHRTALGWAAPTAGRAHQHVDDMTSLMPIFKALTNTNGFQFRSVENPGVELQEIDAFARCLPWAEIPQKFTFRDVRVVRVFSDGNLAVQMFLKYGRDIQWTYFRAVQQVMPQTTFVFGSR